MMNSNTQHRGPGDLLQEPSLTTAQKREILASWASDARAVPNAPSLRQLENGEILQIGSVLQALRALDGDDGAARDYGAGAILRPPFARRKPASMAKWLSRTARRRDFDDDDPPPCPAAAGIPRRRAPADAWAGLHERRSPSL